MRKILNALMIVIITSLLVLNPIGVNAGNNGSTALDFDGTNDYVDATNNGGARRTAASLGMPTAAITVEAWVYPRASAVWVGIANFIQDNGGSEYGWHLGLAGGNRFEFAVAGGGVGLTYLTTVNTYPLNRWYHVAGTYDGTTMRIYVNGVLDTSSGAQNGAITYLDSWLTLGAYRDDNEFFPFNGMIDEVRIWNYARSQAQLQSSMFGEISGATAGLVAYWRFNEGMGTTTADATGNALHLGTLTNMTPASDWIPSTAPLGDATANAQTNVAGFWVASQPTTSGGLTFTNNSFLVDTGDDVIFGHNNATGMTTSDLPAGVGTRLGRIWYCDLYNQSANGGNLDLTFNLTTAGGGTVVNDATYFSLLERAGTSGPFATIVASASSVNTVANTVTFTGVSSGTACSYMTLGTNAPYVVSITHANPNPINAASVDFTVTFSKSVSNVDAGDFTLTTSGVTGAGISLVSGSGATRTVTVNTGSGDGTIRLDLVDNDTIVDTYNVPLGGSGAGNGNYTTGETYTIDKTAPTITSATSTTVNGSYNVPDAINVTLNFSESISSVGLTINLDSGGSVTTGILTNVTSFSGTYTVAAGQNSPDLAVSSITGTITDAATNSMVNPPIPAGQNIADSKDIVIDTIAPALLSITRQTPATSPTSADTLVFRATFSENVQNVDAGDFTVNGTTTATVTGVAVVTANSVYDVTVSGGDLASFNGAVGLDLAGGQNITDLASNPLPVGEPGTDETYVVDNTAPALNSFTRQNPAASPTNADTLVFRATFDVDVQNVDAADFTVAGTTATITGISAVTGTRVYDITLSGGNLAGLSGTVGLDLSGGQNITDLVGNPLPTVEPATDQTYVVDNTAPALTSFTRQNPIASPTNADTLVFQAAFNEDVQNVDTGDFIVNGTTTATVTGITVVDARTYDLTVSGGDLASFNGTVGLDLAGGQNILDLATNPLPAGEPGTDEIYLVDNTPSDVTSILRQTPPGSPTSATSVAFRVTFAEDVQNVDPTDFVLALGGTATGTINAVVVQSASVYDVVLTGVGGNGTLDLDFAATNDIADLGGNPLGAAPTVGTRQNYLIDTTYPTVVFGGSTTPANNSGTFVGPTQVVVEFSKDVLADGSADAANLPANYLLVEDGANGAFDTLACGGTGGGLLPDDTRIPVNAVTYANNGGAGPFLATLNINAGVPLPPGVYRLYICGTSSIYDPAGNRLNNGLDSALNFAVLRPPEALPATGFAPGQVTSLPPQATAYAGLGDLWLEIPRLGVQSAIVGVPTTNGNWDVAWLGSDTGWLQGSAFPTWAGNSVLTGHVYDANGLPGPFLRLNQLWYGDRILVHAFGQEYVYEVRSVRQVRPGETSALTRHETLPWLTLVTCRGYDEAAGTYRYRVVVRAVQVEVR